MKQHREWLDDGTVVPHGKWAPWEKTYMTSGFPWGTVFICDPHGTTCNSHGRIAFPWIHEVSWAQITCQYHGDKFHVWLFSYEVPWDMGSSMGFLDWEEMHLGTNIKKSKQTSRQMYSWHNESQNIVIQETKNTVKSLYSHCHQGASTAPMCDAIGLVCRNLFTACIRY